MKTIFYTLLVVCLGLFGSWDAQAQTNCPPLTPFCQDLNTAYMPGACMVEVWAKDFISKINDGDTDLDDFFISFDPDELVMSLRFFSEDNSPQFVKIYINDGCSSTICEVELDINDNEGNCPEGCVNSQYTGYAVATCTADLDRNGSVAVIYDVRNNQTSAPKGEDWVDLPEINPNNWQIDSLGQIFGIALDEFDNIYFSASDVYKTDYSPVNGFTRGQIFKSSPPSFRAEPFASLPNFGGELNGLGNLAYNSKNNLLYASNLEDGKIYRIDLNGNVLDSFDPFEIDDNTEGIVDISEQIWGIQFNQEGDDCKLYFARIQPGIERSIYSIKLLVDGSFSSLNPVIKEISNLPGVRNRITDIAFSKGGDIMLTAERGTNFVPNTGDRGPHEAQVNKYIRDNSSWNQQPQKLYVGGKLNDSYDAGENSAGGIDFGYKQEGNEPLAFCDSMVWATGNLLRLPKNIPNTNHRFILYGMEGILTSGNSPVVVGDTTSNVYCDLFKDFDGEYLDPTQNLGLDLDDKARIGDVEVFRCRMNESSEELVMARVTGAITSSFGNMLKGAKVHLISDNKNFSTVAKEGYYAFGNLEMHHDYSIEAQFRPTDILDGVTTLDLIKIQRHILGIAKFEDPVSLLAADIDNSLSVSAIDMIELRKIILGKYNSFDKKENWEFYSKDGLDSSFEMKESTNLVEINNLSKTLTELDIVGIKTGDVDGTNSIDHLSQTRVLSLVDGSISKKNVSTGVEYRLCIPNNEEMTGFELDVFVKEDISISNIRTNVSQINDTYLNVGKNGFKLLFDNKIDLENLEINFIITGFNSKKSIPIIGGSIYTKNLVEKRIEFSDSDIMSDLIVYPNPFGNMAELSFTIEDAGSLGISFLNLDGKILSKFVHNGVTGRNSIFIDKEKHLNGESGIFLVNITTEKSSQIIKIATY